MENFTHKCLVCGKTYNFASTLNRHMRTKHVSNNEDVKCGFKTMVCALCSKECISKKQLENHLALSHGCTLEVDELKFCEYKDFLSWKIKIEKDNVCSFVKCSGSSESNGVKTTRFYCHRSGYFSSKGRGKRNLKQIGSNKINGTCPALLKVDESQEGVSVKYVKTHLGHENDIKRLHLTKEEKHSIAVKLVNNTPITAVLDEAHNCSSDKLERINLLTRKDVLNIKQEFKLSTDDVPNSLQTCILRERHTESMKLSFDNILTSSRDEWLVSSETNLDEVYRVRKYAECTDDCTQMCKECKFCLHNFVCTCVDNVEHWNMCEHIHLICKYISTDSYAAIAMNDRDIVDNLSIDSGTSLGLEINNPVNLPHEDWENEIKYLNSSDDVVFLKQLKDSALSLCSDLQKKIHNTGSVVELKEYHKILKAACDGSFKNGEL